MIISPFPGDETSLERLFNTDVHVLPLAEVIGFDDLSKEKAEPFEHLENRHVSLASPDQLSIGRRRVCVLLSAFVFASFLLAFASIALLRFELWPFVSRFWHKWPIAWWHSKVWAFIQSGVWKVWILHARTNVRLHENHSSRIDPTSRDLLSAWHGGQPPKILWNETCRNPPLKRCLKECVRKLRKMKNRYTKPLRHLSRYLRDSNLDFALLPMELWRSISG